MVVGGGGVGGEVGGRRRRRGVGWGEVLQRLQQLLVDVFREDERERRQQLPADGHHVAGGRATRPRHRDRRHDAQLHRRVVQYWRAVPRARVAARLRGAERRRPAPSAPSSRVAPQRRLPLQVHRVHAHVGHRQLHPTLRPSRPYPFPVIHVHPPQMHHQHLGAAARRRRQHYDRRLEHRVEPHPPARRRRRRRRRRLRLLRAGLHQSARHLGGGEPQRATDVRQVAAEVDRPRRDALQERRRVRVAERRQPQHHRRLLRRRRRRRDARTQQGERERRLRPAVRRRAGCRRHRAGWVQADAKYLPPGVTQVDQLQPAQASLHLQVTGRHYTQHAPSLQTLRNNHTHACMNCAKLEHCNLKREINKMIVVCTLYVTRISSLLSFKFPFYLFISRTYSMT